MLRLGRGAPAQIGQTFGGFSRTMRAALGWDASRVQLGRTEPRGSFLKS